MELSIGTGEKTLWEEGKIWLPAFSPFLTMFSKTFFVMIVKIRDCVVKGYNQEGISHKLINFTLLLNHQGGLIN